MSILVPWCALLQLQQHHSHKLYGNDTLGIGLYNDPVLGTQVSHKSSLFDIMNLFLC